MRIRLAEIIGGITGVEATEALVQMVVREADPDVRQSAVDQLGRRGDEATSRLLAALKSKNPEIIGRAALALSTMRAVRTVPKMIDALIQTEKRLFFSQADPTAPLPNTPAYGFVSSSTPNIPANMPPGFAAVGSVPYLTAPAVAPGVIAFGGGSVPVPAGGTATPMINQGSSDPRTPPSEVLMVYHNIDVRRALIELTGEDFGYDQDAWRQWVQNSFRPDANRPQRRVPQPLGRR